MKRLEKAIWLGLIPATAAIWAARRLARQLDVPAAMPPRAEPAMPNATGDDLKVIAGIGPVYEKRLKAAGVRSFADLLATSPEKLLEIVQATPGLADTATWIEQAKQLVGGN